MIIAIIVVIIIITLLLLIILINNNINNNGNVIEKSSHLILSRIFIKVAVWGAATLSKKRCQQNLQHFCEYFLKNTSGWLLLSLLLERPNHWVFLFFFQLSWCWFIDFLVHLACFSPTCQVITMIQIHFESCTVCTCSSLNKLPPGFFIFEWISWKKQENSNEPFIYGLRKTLIHTIF